MSSATSTLKKLAARLRLIPSTSDCDTAVASFQDEKKLDRLETQSQDRSQSTAKKGKAPAISGGPNCCNCCNCSKNGLPSLPDPDLSFKAYDQTWDYEKDEWTDIFRIPKMGNASLTNRVIAYDRKDGRRPHKDHIWIEFRSKLLVELLQPYFQGFSGFSGAQPGVDARHIYTQRKMLRKLVPSLEELQDTPRDLEIVYTDLRRLLEYIEDMFADVTVQLEHMAKDENPQIKWNLLWALFAPDSLVETPESMSSLGMAFKLDSWGYTSSQTLNESEFEIEGEILEWTGFRYAPVPMRRTIMYYTGMRPVKVLSVKPLAEARKAQFTERGRKYIELAGIRHLHYQTHVMWREYDSHGQEVTRKERADGRVMIDAMSFRRFNPGMDQWDVEELSENSPYQDSAGVNQCPSEPELCLLPPTVFGWSFTAKKWGQFVLERLSPIPFEKNAFHNLVLPEDDKHLIKSLVEAQTGMAKGALFEDMIKGKGCGLVLLLHGNPGTGKTLTAEAISEHLQLPLYNVSCSEFGTDLKTVETKLKQILEITSLWKAVVLIDEADIFLEARCDDLQRSSIVGVFLRVLEYHSGIVILTTNRVRTLDQAFKSRISVALKYKDLDFDSRKGLWMKFLSFAGSTIETLGEPDSNYDFSQEDMNTLSEREINGRVIKHVVRTAQALAFSGEERLKIRHIHRVWGILDAFEADLQAENEDRSSKKMS